MMMISTPLLYYCHWWSYWICQFFRSNLWSRLMTHRTLTHTFTDKFLLSNSSPFLFDIVFVWLISLLAICILAENFQIILILIIRIDDHLCHHQLFYYYYYLSVCVWMNFNAKYFEYLAKIQFNFNVLVCLLRVSEIFPPNCSFFDSIFGNFSTKFSDDK